uniref:Protein commissureless n=1 Tax=Ceratitis capitata TaxID=7213 RepID=W8BZD1_CERCA
MAGLTHSLNYQLPHELPHLDTYAQQILENSKTLLVPATPTVPAINVSSTTSSTTNDILQRIGASLLNSIQLKKYIKIDNSPVVGSSLGGDENMDLYGMPPPPNHIAIDSTGFDSIDEMQRQLEYDKFMNEVWIGIVLTLILISMVFCFCSCFLYHQFRMWKRNYHDTITQAHNSNQECEITKLHPDLDDPVPEYTLVSGLPSYEAALELLNKTPKSCLLVHPSVFNVFHLNEKSTNNEQQQQQQHQQQQQQQLQHLTSQTQLVEVTTPLLSSAMSTAQQQEQQQQNLSSSTPTGMLLPGRAYAVLPTYEEANSQHDLLHATNVTLTTVNEKSTTTNTTTTTTMTTIHQPCAKTLSDIGEMQKI